MNTSIESGEFVFELSDKQKSRLLEAVTDQNLSESEPNNDIEDWLRGK